MHTPGQLNLICYQGATFDKTLTWRIDNNAVNLTGYTARMMVKYRNGPLEPILSLTSSAGITLGGVAGTVTIAVSATDTANLPAGVHLYDLELINGTTVTRLIEGTFTVDPEVTR